MQRLSYYRRDAQAAESFSSSSSSPNAAKAFTAAIMTLMPPVALCYSPLDRGAAVELSAYLQANCSVSIEDAVMPLDGDLLDSIEQALSLDYVLVLLSSHSAGAAWPRARWESVLIDQPKQFETRLAYILLEEDCKFPAVLRKESFFDLSFDFASGRRAVKRWLFSRLAPQLPPLLPARSTNHAAIDIEALESLADWSGYRQAPDRETALAFAHACHADFEAVVWLNATRRGRAGVLGDVAYALGLRLNGDWEQNARELTAHCSGHRLLLVFENLEPDLQEFVNFEGKASIVTVESAAAHPRMPLPELLGLFSSWRSHAPKCFAALADVESHLDSPEILEDDLWPDACSLCDAAVALLNQHGRFAEAYDLLTRISSAMQIRGDSAALDRIEWETSWILERWGRPLHLPGRLAAAIAEPEQLSLF